MEELIKHGHLKDKSSFPKLIQLVQTFEEKVNASAKTEVLVYACVCNVMTFLLQIFYRSCRFFISWSLLIV